MSILFDPIGLPRIYCRTLEQEKVMGKEKLDQVQAQRPTPIWCMEID
jgi:hypothetical protein